MTEFMTRDEAFFAEQTIKKWSKKKKFALINNDWILISELGKKIFNKN
jgi:predicted GIY-YIG superfamily endonuclease